MCDYESKLANAGSEPVRYMEMCPGLPSRHFQTDLPIHTPGGWGHYIKGWLQRRTDRMVFFMVHMSRTVQPTVWGHNSQFYWTSARVKCSTCFSRPMHLYYSHLSVLNVHMLLFWPKKSLTTAPSSGLYIHSDSLTLATMKPLPMSENNLIVAHNIIDLLDLFIFFFEHGSQHWFILQDVPICRPINWGWR